MNITQNELICFIGINFFMGYHVLRGYKHYWNTSPDVNVPLVSSAMTRNRFQESLSYLHVSDNLQIPNKDKVYKLRPMIDDLNKQFAQVYHGTRELSVDGSMIVFKVHSSVKQ
ncbi:Transposase IS4 [Popillia japonica]|uniref:Transposase IS4 n=1 Tax=Popillia japonica TaxID=7064 RepID=A0AAW1JIQ3_POPJA